MKAKGNKKNGKVVYFNVVNGTLNCGFNQLTSLEVPNSVTTLDCSYNQLTSLEVSNSVTSLYCRYNEFVNSKTTFINPQTNRVVFYQNGKYHCGCCCQKTASDFKSICLEKGFNEIIQHFGL